MDDAGRRGITLPERAGQLDEKPAIRRPIANAQDGISPREFCVENCLKCRDHAWNRLRHGLSVAGQEPSPSVRC